jgi:hypothetical protein
MQWSVSKSFIAKDRSLAPVLRFAQRVSQVRRNPALLTGDEVFGRAILVIGYHRLRLRACVALMLIAFYFQRYCQALSRSRSRLPSDHQNFRFGQHALEDQRDGG